MPPDPEWPPAERGRFPAHAVTGVDLWPFRVAAESIELLLLHRVVGTGPAFWQGVSGWIEPEETPHAAAVRELDEETGLSAEALYALDTPFDLYAWERGTVESIVPFAARVAGDRDPILSDEHDAFRWVPLDEALGLLPYGPQRASVRAIVEDIAADPAHASLWEIPLQGR